MPIIGVVIAIFIFAWAILGLMAIDPIKINTRSYIEILLRYALLIVAAFFGVVGIIFAIYGFNYLHPTGNLKDFLTDFYSNIVTTCIGIFITVLIIDRLNARRIFEQRKQEIFEEIESPVRDVAVEAVRLARKHGYLDEALQKVDLMNAQLAGAHLQRVNLPEKNMIMINLQNAYLLKANLQGAFLGYANLQGSSLWGANLQNADLRGANLKQSHLGEINLQEANLQNADLEDANLSAAILIKADLSETNLKDTTLQNADLQEANLQEANMQGAYLWQANLQGAILFGANLQDADVSGANLRGADLRTAKCESIIYDEYTIWPKGFKPKGRYL